MTKLARTIPKLTLLTLLAAPVYASITYTSCSSGCDSTTGTYNTWQLAPGSAGLTFSPSPITFVPGNLTSSVYTDPSGTMFTSFIGPSTIDTAMSVSGTSLRQSLGGTGTGVEILLPANTYAVAFDITASGYSSLWVALGNHNVGATNYNVIVTASGNIQFFGITSPTPITELFIGPISGFNAPIQLNDFEIAQTPELSSVILMGSGLLLLALLRRRIHIPNGTVA